MKRETEEEKEFGDFDVIGDGDYSTFKFTYDPEDFDRMVALMEYNVMNNSGIIKEAIMRKIHMKNKQREDLMNTYKKAVNNMALEVGIALHYQCAV